MTTSDEGTHGRDVIVSINEGSPKSNIWKGSSYDFAKHPQESGNGGFNFQQRGASGDGGQAAHVLDDPPSKLIGQFLHKQKASGDFALDMDLEMDELRRDKDLPSVDESPSTARASKEYKVTFHPPVSNAVEQPNDAVRRRYRDSLLGEDPQRQHQSDRGSDASPNADDNGGEVVRCTSNTSYDRSISFQRKSTLLKTKTKSRLLDPPEEPERKSGRTPKSEQSRSGFVGRIDEEEDDPFMEEDLPDDFTKSNFNALTLLQWVSLILIVTSLICTLCIPYLRDKNLWQLRLWKWEVMILVLICGRLVSGWGIRIIVYFVERNFILRKKVLYFVYGVRKAVQNCLWLGLVLIAWHFLFDKKVQADLKTSFPVIVTKILICLLVGTLVWLVKTLLVKVLASSFHVSTYFDRIQESLFNQFVIETLSGPPVVEMRKAEEEEEKLAEEVRKMQNAGVTIPPDLKASAFQSPKSGRVIGSSGVQKSPRGKSGIISREHSRTAEEGITIDQLHKLNPKNVSAWNMKRLMNIIRHGSITTLDEHAIDSTADDESATQIRSENEAKAAAKKIFQNVARHGCRYIYLEDLMRFMREDEAAKTISLFEGASECCESGKISKSALKNWVVHAFRERRALALTLNDTKTAVNRLHRMLNFLVAIIIFIIWLLVLGIATSKFLVVVSSQLVVAAFIFGNTCKTVFEAIIFLFVIHPFDVGDRCDIDGIQMVVEEMKILTTVFLRYDNMKIIIPNSVLSTKPIHNYYRSPDMGDAVEFCVHVATPAEKIAAIKQRISSYIDSKKEHWYPNPLFFMKDVEELNRLRIAVWLVHRMTYQNIGERWVRRGQLIEEMSKIFRELDIQYRLYPVDINICAVPSGVSDRLPSSWAGTKS